MEVNILGLIGQFVTFTNLVESFIPPFASRPSFQQYGKAFDERGIGSDKQIVLCQQMAGQIASRKHSSVGQSGTEGPSAIPHRRCSLQATSSRVIRALQGRQKGTV